MNNDQMREAFEVHAEKRGLPLDETLSGAPGAGPQFVYIETHEAWEAWQAALKHTGETQTASWTAPPQSARPMRPTEHLRFLERQEDQGDGTARRVRVLQQSWAPLHGGGPCEWRDVPMATA
jgi:hypothetical protein